MAERVQEPSRCDIHAEFLAVISLAVLNLPNERFDAGFADIRHDIHPQHQLEAPLADELPERRLLLRVPFQKRLHIRNLIQGKRILRMLLQKLERMKNM